MINIIFLKYTFNGREIFEFFVKRITHLIGTSTSKCTKINVATTRRCSSSQQLHSQFPEKWIGTNGPLSWPPRSPDLTPLDFFCGDILKIKCTPPNRLHYR